MAAFGCNVQLKLTAMDRIDALSEGSCRMCGTAAWELQARGLRLEVCAEEYVSGFDAGTTARQPVPLCPDCHRTHHLDAHDTVLPCPFKARASRESLGLW